MAIKALAIMVHAFEPPVYCYHEIVHNKLIVQRFEDLGVKFVNDVAEVPAGAPLMLSAHGSAPEVVAQAHATGGYVVDSVCPLVTKVHHEVKVRAKKGYQVVYIGHLGHEEAAGTIAVAPESIHLVESVDAVAQLPQFDDPVALLAQTTLSQRDWSDIAIAAQQKYADIWTPGRSDLCFATTNRQAALREPLLRAVTPLWWSARPIPPIPGRWRSWLRSWAASGCSESMRPRSCQLTCTAQWASPPEHQPLTSWYRKWWLSLTLLTALKRFR